MNISSSSFKLGTVNSLKTVIGFIGLTLFARELGSHYIGIFFLFQALLQMIKAITNLGVDGSVVKRLSEGEHQGNTVTTAILIKIGILVVATSGIVLFRNQINNYLGVELALVFALALVLEVAAGFSMTILHGELRVGETAYPNFLRRLTYVVVGYFLILAGFKTRALVYGLLVGMVLQLLWGVKKTDVSLGRPSVVQASSLLNFAKYSFISRISGSVYAWMDIAIIGFFLTQASVGVYEVAWRVSVAVMVVINAISATIFPQISEWATNGEIERIESMIPNAIAPGMFLLIPACFGAAYLSTDIFRLIFGPEYTAGWFLLIIFMIGKTIQGISRILTQILNGLDRPDLTVRSKVASLVVNLVLNVVLVLEFGLGGIAVATVLSVAVLVTVHVHYVTKFMTIRIPFVRIGGSIVAAAGMLTVLSQIRTLVKIESIPVLVAMIVTGIVVYGMFALLIPPLRTMILTHTRQIAPRFSP